MKHLLSFVVIYVLFLVQAALTPWSPDLLLLAVVIIALHEKRLPATLYGAWAGLLAGLTGPETLGISLFLHAGLGYGIASLHTIAYRSRWYLFLLVAAGLLLKVVTGFAVSVRPAWGPQLAVSILLTLALALPAESAASRTLHRQ